MSDGQDRPLQPDLVLRRRARYGEADLAGAARDIVKGLNAVNVWWTLALGELKARYRRSLLGPFWMTLTSAVTVLGLGYLWAELWAVDLKSFYPYIAAGLVTWNYIASVLVEGPSCYISQAHYLKSSPAPLMVFPVRTAARLFLLYLHQLPVVLLVIALFAPMPTPVSLLAFVGVGLIAINSVWIIGLLGMIGARIRDVAFLVEAGVPLLFFLTPILWQTQSLKRSFIVAELNPLYHAIQSVRAPLMGEVPSWTTYAVMIGGAVLGWIALLVAFQYRRRIVFWVQ